MMGVGGSFEIYSGTKKRAPKLFIQLNIEWVYRLLIDWNVLDVCVVFLNLCIKF